MLMRPEKRKETGGDPGELKDVNAHEGDLRILVFRSVITSSEKTVSFYVLQFMKVFLFETFGFVFCCFNIPKEAVVMGFSYHSN